MTLKVIVTGASKGIGKGIVDVLAKHKCHLGLIARSGDLLEDLRFDISTSGGVCHSSVCDIRNHAETAAAIQDLIKLLGGVDALINNAGLVIRKDVLALSVEEWQMMMETNVNGVFYASRAVLPTMKEQGSGHIINISSISGKLPLAGGSGYAASKYAVTGFSESLFQEVRQWGIKVSTVFPGSVDSESHRHDPNEDHSWKVTPEDVGIACYDILTTKGNTLISQVEIRPSKKPE
jgi:NADP-dependent 3-hydroxy acid dehydrogenase YdfG